MALYETKYFLSYSEDMQTFLLPDLGRLKRMKVLHDNTGTAPSWYLKKVIYNIVHYQGFKKKF